MVWHLITLLCLALAPEGMMSAVARVPAWIGRCLSQLPAGPLSRGAPLPTDSPRSAEHGSCAARCAGRCFLLGDFNGDGSARELAVASPSELLLFRDVEQPRKGHYRLTPAGRLPLCADEVALLSLQRTLRFAHEVGLLKEGRSLLPQLQKGERMAFGVLLWRGSQTSPQEDFIDDHSPTGQIGDLLVAVEDEVTHVYRLQHVLELGATHE